MMSGGHVLHMICDLALAADNARFGQTGPKVGSFDSGYGASHMARMLQEKPDSEAVQQHANKFSWGRTAIETLDCLRS